MCTGVIVASSPAAHDALRTVPHRGLGTPVIGTLADGRLLWAISASGGCGCELFREEADHGESYEARRLKSIAAREQRYRRQGWSEAKIARALRDAKLGADHRTTEEGPIGLRTDAGRLFEVVAGHDAGAEMVVHSFSGSYEIMLDEFMRMPGQVVPRGEEAAWCREIRMDVRYRLGASK
jgi:hypothetical protein